MKSTDVLPKSNPLQNLLDRPIAFHRCFVQLGIGITGAIMLSQAVYWSKRTANSEGWFHKSIEEWEEETGLTRFEQETAKRNLKGILEIERRGIPARLYFRIDWNELEKSFINHSLLKTSNQDCENPSNKNDGNLQTRLRKSRKLDCGNSSNRIAEKQQTGLLDSSNLYKEEVLITSKTTAEITTETTIPPTPKMGRRDLKTNPRNLGTNPRANETNPRTTGTNPRSNASFEDRQTSPPNEKNESAKGDGSPSRQNTVHDEIPLPKWLDPKDWNDYRAYRTEIKSPMTPLAIKRAIAELDRLRNEGQDPARVIAQSIINGWKGLFPIKTDSVALPRKTFDQIRAERTQAAAQQVLDEIYGPEDNHGTISL